MKIAPCSWIGRLIITEMTVLPQSDRQTQCSCSGNPRGLSCRNRQAGLKIHTEIQELCDSRTILRSTKLKESRFWFQNLLQSYRALEENGQQSPHVV